MYYTLLVKFDRKGPWGPEFGDIDRDMAEAEAEAYRDEGHRTKIIATEYTDGQAAVDFEVARLNGFKAAPVATVKPAGKPVPAVTVSFTLEGVGADMDPSTLLDSVMEFLRDTVAEQVEEEARLEAENHLAWHYAEPSEDMIDERANCTTAEVIDAACDTLSVESTLVGAK